MVIITRIVRRGDRYHTLDNIRRLGAEVLPHLARA
jgi:hypothetical protein